MKTVHAPLKFRGALACAALLAVLATSGARAQSTEIDYPTPIRTNEIAGTIAPRDLGDPRVTRYFYTFTGTPGDLIVTAESRNLEGAVDVYTSGTLRPLAQISLYAGASASGGTTTIYLKRREVLILRVEARTPNDLEGSFRVRFSGGFEPMGSDVPDPEPVTPTISSERSSGKTRRVTATGARINEPEPAPTTQAEETRPADTSSEATKPATETSEAAAETAKAEPEKPRPSRVRRPRTPRRTRRQRPAPTPTETTTQPSAPAETNAAAQPTTVEPMSGPRLIIETRDGMRVERYMTTVRRVTVENGQLIVVGRNGKVERQPMTNVLRMAIEP